MRVIIIAAVARNRVIGKGGKVPWDIPDDMERFKQLTKGHTVLMGRKSYESLGKPLPDRRNIVLTSGALPGIETYPTMAEALQGLENEEKVFVIGGGEIFAQLLDSADELQLTLVDQDVDGDTFFPPYEHLVGSVFQLVNRETHEGFTYMNYVRTG
jgi:dihydrofolate reductase